MYSQKVQEEPCHVCQHLGQKQCKYTSHKKYRKHQANTSFLVGNLIQKPTITKADSYLKNFQQKKFEFQFPSSIPTSIQASPSKIFQRTLIEKVLEEKTPIKYLESNQIMNSNQLMKQRQPIAISKFDTNSMMLNKNEAEATKTKLNNKHVMSSFAMSQTPNISPIKLQQRQIIHQSYRPPQNFKYHFNYGQKHIQHLQKPFLRSQALKTLQKQNDSSFHIEQNKNFNRTNSIFGETISRNPHQRQKSRYFLSNIFKDTIQIENNNQREKSENEKLNSQQKKPQLTEFNSKKQQQRQQSYSKLRHHERLLQKSEQKKHSYQENFRVQPQHPVVNSEFSQSKIISHLSDNKQHSPYKQAQQVKYVKQLEQLKELKEVKQFKQFSNQSPYKNRANPSFAQSAYNRPRTFQQPSLDDFSNHSLKQSLITRHTHANATDINGNINNYAQKIYSEQQIAKILNWQNQRRLQGQSISRSQGSRLFYPIYPVYEVVYELVQVVPLNFAENVHN